MGAVTNSGGGTVTNSAGTMASLNNSNGTATNAGAILGGVTNGGTFNAAAGSSIGLGVTNTGTFNATGNSTFGTNFANTSGTVNLNAGGLSGATMSNGGTVNIGNQALTLTGALVNTGGVYMQAGSALNAPLIIGAGTLFVSNGTTVNASMSGGTVDLSAQDGSAGNNATIAGSVSGGMTFVLDVDLSATPDADWVTVAGATSGNLAFTFVNATVGDLAQITTDVLVFDGVAGSSFTTSTSTLPVTTGSISYYLQSVDGDVFIRSLLDPAAASVPGNVAIVQSLLGTIINRPSSPFVSGLAYEDDKNCGSGTWGRANAGYAKGKTTTTNSSGATTNRYPGEVSTTYGGVQAGYDFGCFNSGGGKWDLAAGAFLGYNLGSTHQDVRSFDPITQTQGPIASTTKGKFQQGFVGLYFAGATGPWSTDVQLRYEATTFAFTNNQATVGLDDTEMDTTAATLSGSVSYAMPLKNDWVLVPTGGLAVTQTQASSLTFENGALLDMDSHLSPVAFVGGTLAKTKINEAGDAAFNKFFTATIYNDFGGDRTAVYTEGTSSDVSSASLGAFGELSAGLSYVKILEGQVGKAKQLNASIRADARLSSNVQALGVTAQVRLQF